MILFLFFISIQTLMSVQAVNWQNGNWAFACDFKGGDLNNARVPADKCGPTCEQTSGCTHFSWSTFNGGTCWMKSGKVSKSDAIDTGDQSMVCGVSGKSPETPIKPSQPGKLKFSDEFDYNGLPDSNKWNQETGGNGWGNNELQFYTNQNARVENGFLTIETKMQNWENRQYTSSRLISKTAFKYGIFEMRAKLPQGRGTWPAFWLLNTANIKWPETGELDILEHVGYDPGVIHANIHCKKYNHMIGTNKGNSIRISNPFDQFHTYKLDWNADRVIFYVDDIQYFSYANTEKTYEAWPFDLPENILINTAVGGNWGGAKGVDNSIFPQKYVIDYVRVYEN